MKFKLSRLNLRLLSNVIFYLLVTIIWSLVTLKMNSYESQSGYFEIKALMQFKILLPVVVFWGRCLLFDQYRQGRKNVLNFLLALFLVGWSVFDKLIGIKNWGYGLLVGTDLIIWAFLIKETFETVSEIISYWKDLPKTNYALIKVIWAKIEQDLIRLGIWITSLIGLGFFYLVSFFIVDALFCSCLLLIPLLGSALLIYGLLFSKIKSWVSGDLALIDSELVEQLDWNTAKEDPELPQRIAWFQYLTLIKSYLNQLQQPAILVKSLLFYSLDSGLILSLPYLFGRVIEV
ncbi:MAG: hypothetical protein GXY86_17480 [Firmicutes bacterium]|nr:hypothetical protein [Bacillota bacterium]